MKSCDEVLDRLYDEDCRQALKAGGSLPTEIASHLASCPGCNSVRTELGDDALELRALLSEDAPLATKGALLAALEEACPPRAALIDWRSALVWGISTAALAGCAVVFAGTLLPLVWQAVLVSAAASLGAAAELTRQGLEA